MEDDLTSPEKKPQDVRQLSELLDNPQVAALARWLCQVIPRLWSVQVLYVNTTLEAVTVTKCGYLCVYMSMQVLSTKNEIHVLYT